MKSEIIKEAKELKRKGYNWAKIALILAKKYKCDFNANSLRARASEYKDEAPKKESPKTFDNNFEKKVENTIYKFGVVSDCHIGSKYQQLTYLQNMYDLFVAEEIEDVFNVGDITEGCKMRAGHEHEIFLHGADSQVDYVVKHYPKRKGITTYFITGNHDLSHMKNGGVDIGKAISTKRKDMEYIGALNARVQLTENCVMEMNHPLDGSSYAISYSIQKMIDSYGGDSKPNILLNGHHHKMFYLFYRNVHGVESGTFEAQTPWMRGKRLAAHLGGLIITVEFDNTGSIVRFVPEFIPFYVEKKDDY